MVTGIIVDSKNTVLSGHQITLFLPDGTEEPYVTDENGKFKMEVSDWKSNRSLPFVGNMGDFQFVDMGTIQIGPENEPANLFAYPK